MASINYEDGEIVWVKLSNSWWPGEVCDESVLPEGALSSLKKSPIAVVKFFNEDSFEFVRNFNCIYKYNCSKKNEFIRKGLELYRSNNQFAEKFPADVQIAETKTGGDKDILDSEEFAPNTSSTRRSATKTMVKMIFGENTAGKTSNEAKNKKNIPTKLSFLKGTSTVTIKDLTQSQEKLSPQIISSDLKSKPATTPTTGLYKCHLCSFASQRQNVIIIHIKTHKKISMSNSLLLSTPEKSPTNKSSSPSVIVIDDDSEGESRLSKLDLATPTTNNLLLNSTLENRTSLNKSPNSPTNEDLTNLSAINEGLNRPVRQPPKKQLSQRLQIQTIENEKQREITNIIADWSDTEDLETPEVSKSIKGLTKSEANSASSIQPQPKIRNIPKKDRRAIVFDDFNSKDLMSSSNSSTSNENTKEFEEKCIPEPEDNLSNSDLDKAASALKDLSENTKSNSEKMENDVIIVEKDITEKSLELDVITEHLKTKKLAKNLDIEKDNSKILENIENYYEEIDETTEKFDKILKDTETKKTTTKSKRTRTSEINKLLDGNNAIQDIGETTRKSLRRANKNNSGTPDKIANDVEIPSQTVEDTNNEKNVRQKSTDSKNLDDVSRKNIADNFNISTKEYVSKDGNKEKLKSNDLNINMETTKNKNVNDTDKSKNNIIKSASTSSGDKNKLRKQELDEFKHLRSKTNTLSSPQEEIVAKYTKATRSQDSKIEQKSVKVKPIVENSLSKFEKVLKVKINKTPCRKHNTKNEGEDSIVKKPETEAHILQTEVDNELDIKASKNETIETKASEIVIDSKKTKTSKRLRNISKSSDSFEKKESEDAHEEIPVEIKSNAKINSNKHTPQRKQSTKTEEIVPLKNNEPSKTFGASEAEEISSMRTLRNRDKYSKLFVEIIDEDIESPAMSPLRKSLKSPIEKVKKPSPLTRKDKTQEISQVMKNSNALSEQVKKSTSYSVEKVSEKSKQINKHDEDTIISKDKIDSIKVREANETEVDSDKIESNIGFKNVTDSLIKSNTKNDSGKSEANGQKILDKTPILTEIEVSKINQTSLPVNETAKELEFKKGTNVNSSSSILNESINADKKKKPESKERSVEIKKHNSTELKNSAIQNQQDKIENESSLVILDDLKNNNQKETIVKSDKNNIVAKFVENAETNTDEPHIFSEPNVKSDTTAKSFENENVKTSSDKRSNRIDFFKAKLTEHEKINKPVDKNINEKSSKAKENKDLLATKNLSPISTNFSAEVLSLDIIETPEKTDNSTNVSENPPESAVFDFRDDDEDFEVLTTISELKKKYSPEKSKSTDDYITSPIKNESKTTSEEKCQNEKLDSSKLHLSENVKGSKIKEKNKRIFKSRNRSNESTTSSSTTIASFITSSEPISSPQPNKASLKDFDLIIPPSPENKNEEGKDEESSTMKRQRSYIKIIPRKFDQKPSTSDDNIQNMDYNKESLPTENLVEKSTKDVKVLELNTNQVLLKKGETKTQSKSPITSVETTSDIRSFRRSKNLKLSKTNQDQIVKEPLKVEDNKFTEDKTDSDIVKAVDQIASLQKSPSVTVAINNSNNQCKLFEKYAIEVKTDITLVDQISNILHKAPETTTKKRKQTIEEEIISSKISKSDSSKKAKSPIESTQPAPKISKIERKAAEFNVFNSKNSNYNEEMNTKMPNQSQQINDLIETIETIEAPVEQLFTTNVQDNVRLILATPQIDQTNISSNTINPQETIQQQISQLNQQDQLSRKHRGRPKKSLDSPPSHSIAHQSSLPSQAPSEQYGYDSKGNRLVIIKYGSGSKPIMNEKLIIKQPAQPSAMSIINSETQIPLDNSPTVSVGEITTNQIILTNKGNVNQSYTTLRTNSPVPIQENIQQTSKQVQKNEQKSMQRPQSQTQFSRPRKRKIEQTVTSPPPLASISSNETNAAKQQKFINTITKSLTNTLNTSSSTSAQPSVPDEEIQSRIMAVPACHFNLAGNAYYLCSHDNDGNYMPIDNQELYLDPETNQLVPAAVIQQKQQEAAAQNIILTNENDVVCVEVNDQQQQQQVQQSDTDISNLLTQQQVVINIDGQQLILDHQDFMALAASNGETQLVTADGQTFIISPEFLQALGICGGPDAVQQQLLQQENIVETNLDNSTLIGDVLQIESTEDALLQHNTQAETNETNAILTQPPIMSTLETPSSSNKKKLSRNKQIIQGTDEVLRPQNLDDCIAFIATQSSNVPSSLELPITVTNPNIAPKSSSNNLYNKALVASTDSQISPNAQLQFTSEQALNELFITSNACDVQQKIIIEDNKADEHDINDYSNQSSVVSGINFDDPR